MDNLSDVRVRALPVARYVFSRILTVSRARRLGLTVTFIPSLLRREHVVSALLVVVLPAMILVDEL
jgi:hypothetical protein